MTARFLVSAGLVAAGLLAGCGGCKKDAPPEVPPSAPPPPAATTAEALPPPPGPRAVDAGDEDAPEPPGDGKVVVDEALVGQYLAYLKLPRATPASSAGERLAEEKRLARAAGLRWAQVEAMGQLMVGVVESRRLYQLTGGDPELEKVRKKLAELPEKKRAELEPQIKAAQAKQLTLRDVPEARARWGDAAVDAVIKREKELGEAWDAARK